MRKHQQLTQARIWVAHNLSQHFELSLFQSKVDVMRLYLSSNLWWWTVFSCAQENVVIYCSILLKRVIRCAKTKLVIVGAVLKCFYREARIAIDRRAKVSCVSCVLSGVMCVAGRSSRQTVIPSCWRLSKVGGISKHFAMFVCTV